jgi:NAD(P)H-flavin reductase
MVPLPYRVAGATPESPGVTTMLLEPAGRSGAIHFDPAQFGMVGVPGFGEVPISFSSDPDADDHIGITVRHVGAATRALTAAPLGSVVGLRGPYGEPWPIEAAEDRELLVVAGGLGLAPLRSLLVVTSRRRDRFARLGLAYGARSPADILYGGDLDGWSRHGVEVAVTVDRADSAWTGRTGLVTELFESLVERPAATGAMMCGPDQMMLASGIALIGLGVSPSRIWVTLERNMQCGIGLCGHCQLGSVFVCRDGPVFRFDRISALLGRS